MDEYFKDLEITLTNANMHEDHDESNIPRFVSGLRREIQDVVELYEYTYLEKLVHLSIMVESQLLNKDSFNKSTHNVDIYKTSWKDKNKFQNENSPSNFQENPPTK